MKLIVNGGSLYLAAKTLNKVIRENDSLPILTDILCEVSNQVMKMTASNGEVAITTSVTLESMEGDGRFCVPAAQMLTALKALKLQPVTIIADVENGNQAFFKIQHMSGEIYFSLDNADEYPTWDNVNYTEDMVIDADLMKDAVKRVSFAAEGISSLRPIMEYICFKMDDGMLDIVATNGHVIAKVSIDGDTENPTRCGSFLMPRSVGRLTGDLSGNVTAKWNTAAVMISDGNVTISFKQPEGRYPNYKSVIPKGTPREAVVLAYELRNTLQSVLPFANDSSMMVILTLSRGKLRLKGEDTDFRCGAFSDIAIDYEGEEISIGLNGSHLMKVLKSIPLNETVISFSDNSHPILIEPEEQFDDKDILMLMTSLIINEHGN